MDWANDNAFLTRLEQLQFALSKSSSELPSSQADAYRNLYLHLTDAKRKSSSSEFSALTMEADRNAEMYANIVDNMDESGLNNFAAGALSLCHYHKNESSKWQTSLAVNDILSLPGLQDTDQMAKADKSDHANKAIPLKIRKKAVDNTSGNTTSLVPLPSKQSHNHISTQKKAHHTSAFGNTNGQGWKNQPEVNPFKTYEKKNSQLPAMSSNSNKSESVSVMASKVGGPYANFGQKRKVQNNWKSGTEGSKSWPRKCEDDEDDTEKQTPFRTAREQLVINQQKKFGNSNERNQVSGSNYGSVKKSLGTRRGPANKFVPPVLGQDSDEGDGSFPRSTFQRDQKSGGVTNGMEEPVDERLIGIDPNMIELIKNEIMDHGAQISWSDIAGLEFAKKTIKEIVVWPMLRPDIFTGLRGPPKGLLLFGPPGTGKTLIGKCIASQSKSTFFCISASTLTSKWVGEGEKMVRALFAVARCSQPAVVFIDEVDSLLSQRSDSEHESSRRIKTEFLVQLDGASTASDERLLVIGATNRPQEIDEAARRRFVKRLLIPLPKNAARMHIIVNLMSQQRYNLNDSDLQQICDKTEGYSGADMSNLCREAALGPIRSIPFEEMETITPDQVRPILVEDFEEALLQVRASVSPKDLELYVDWNKTYGSFGHG